MDFFVCFLFSVRVLQFRNSMTNITIKCYIDRLYVSAPYSSIYRFIFPLAHWCFWLELFGSEDWGAGDLHVSEWQLTSVLWQREKLQWAHTCCHWLLNGGIANPLACEVTVMTDSLVPVCSLSDILHHQINNTRCLNLNLKYLWPLVY